MANLGRPELDSAPELSRDVDELADGLTEEIYSEAVEETAAQLVHELEPVLGILKVLARKEIPQYEKSQTYVQILRLERLLTAIDTLRRAASPPNITEFDLADVIRRIADEAKFSASVDISFAGPRPFIVLADQSLVELALKNGVRNALESTAFVQGVKSSVVITWGDTDRDYWISVLDEGIGIPAGRTGSVFEIGITSKKDHLGMGLALAKQAVTSLRGEITLQPRSPKGAAYKFSWPKPDRR
jgi:signal transduction histidine kinase